MLLALVNRSPSRDLEVGEPGPRITVHALVMALAGSALSVAVVRAGVPPRRIGVPQLVGVVLVALAALLPGATQVHFRACTCQRATRLAAQRP